MKNSNGNLSHHNGLNGFEVVLPDATDRLPTDAGLCYEHIQRMLLKQLEMVMRNGAHPLELVDLQEEEAPDDIEDVDLVSNGSQHVYREGHFHWFEE